MESTFECSEWNVYIATKCLIYHMCMCMCVPPSQEQHTQNQCTGYNECGAAAAVVYIVWIFWALFVLTLTYISFKSYANKHWNYNWTPFDNSIAQSIFGSNSFWNSIVLMWFNCFKSLWLIFIHAKKRGKNTLCK